MADFKYVMFRDEARDPERLIPVIFPASLVHSEVAEAIIRMGIRGEDGMILQPVSAGFLTLAVASTHGMSESMKLESQDKDAMLINTHAYTSGVESGMEPMIEKMLLSKLIEQLLEKIT